MKKFVLAIALAGMAIAPAAMAQEEFAFDFSFNRAELSTQEGAQEVYDRLLKDVRNACRIQPGLDPLGEVRAEKICVKNTMETAMQKFNSPIMAEAHEQKYGPSIG